MVNVFFLRTATKNEIFNFCIDINFTIQEVTFMTIIINNIQRYDKQFFIFGYGFKK